MLLKAVRFLTLAFVTFFSLSFSTVFAQDATSNSQILTTTLEVRDTTNYKISGDISLNNATNKGYDNFYLITKLIEPGKVTETKGLKSVSQGLVVDYLKSGPYSLAPGEERSQNFEFKYPATISQGNYNITTEVISQDTSSQGIAAQEVALIGSGTFLDIDPSSCKVNVNGQIYDYFEGPNVKISEGTEASCVVENTTGKKIEARMQFIYAVNSVPQNPDSVNQLETQPLTVFNTGQDTTIKFRLPTNLAPQVYEGLFRLTDQAGQKVSVNIPYRWIIIGPSSAITNLVFDKTYYKKDQIAKLNIGILPSADLSWRGNTPPFSPDQGTDLINAKLNLKITDDRGGVCSQTTKNLPSTKDKPWGSFDYGIKMERDCLNPVVEATVVGEGIDQPLSKMTIKITSTENDLKTSGSIIPLVSKSVSKAPVWAWLVAIIVGVFIVAGVVIYFLKFRKKDPPISKPDQPPFASSSPNSAVTTAAVLILLGVGYLLGGLRFGILDRLNIESVFAQQETVKNPVNSNDALTKTVFMKDRWDGRSEIWGNVRDFKQNNAGGDSEITILPDCEKINIRLKGSAGSGFSCSNWGPGLAVKAFIDSTQMEVTDASSPIGNEVYPQGKDHFSILQFNQKDGQREAIFSITPTRDQKIGTHSAILKVGISHMVRHTEIEHYTTSFENKPSCDGTGPCYVLMKYDFMCKEPLACNAACNTKDDCYGNKEGCTECRANEQGQKSCQPPPACNASCTTQEDCKSNLVGCIDCRPDTTGKNLCQKPPLACNAACGTDKDCFGNKEGCNSCLEGVCRKPAACNDSCTTDVTCEKAVDGCTACVNGSCRIPPACGTACTTKADCSGAKESCSDCLEGTCTDYNDNMCKCDGITAELNYPNPFKFEAFGKVEGGDIAKAEIADVTFRLTKDNVVVARSNPITPTVVENTGTKMRYKADWQTQPPVVDKNATYRVFADVRCKPKRITVADASQISTPNPNSQKLTQKDQAVTPSPAPKGLELALKGLNNLFGNSAEVRSFTGKLLTMFSTSTVYAQDSNLQLATLNFIKLMDTDNCRFVMFKFDETLF